MPFDRDHDTRIRAAVFEWLAERSSDVFDRTDLVAGIHVHGERVPLIGPQGIFKPRVMDLPLSITTSPNTPYDDAFGTDGLLRYRYRGKDPDHPDNRGLRQVMTRNLPLVYFHGLLPGKYEAAWPVYIVGDDPVNLTITVAVDDMNHVILKGLEHAVVHDEESSARRKYITSAVRSRLHQRSFRERVLEAYRRQCAFCRLRHDELLDAAHIVPDADPEGEARVQNGLSLCKLHHAAFDRQFIGLRPDYVLDVREDIRREIDGPTLLHAIQGLHGAEIQLPSRESLYPDVGLVERRYEAFSAR